MEQTIFDQIHQEQQTGGNIFDQIHAEAAPQKPAVDSAGRMTPGAVFHSGMQNPTVKAVTDLLPTPRTVARGTGGIVGAGIGAPSGPLGAITGAAAGSAGADALYNDALALVQWATGKHPDDSLPTTAEGVLSSAGGAAATGAAQEAIPMAAAKLIGGKMAAGKALEDAYDAIPNARRIPSDPIKAVLQQKQAETMVQGDVVPAMEARYNSYQKLIDWFDAHPSFTADELRQNKQLWDEVQNFRRMPESNVPETEKVYADAANAVRDSLHRQFPDVAKADRSYHLWSKAGELLGGTNAQRAIGAGVGSGVGAGVGSMVGAPGTGAIAGGFVGQNAGPDVIRALMNSGIWKVATLPARQTALKALQTGGISEAIKALTGFGINGLADKLQRGY